MSSSVYRLRPSWEPRWEPDVYVPATLAAMGGPTSGAVDPPVHLYWQPGALDFATDRDLRLFYSSMLGAAATSDDFENWVDRRRLTALWDRLPIPARIRSAWETIHPELRSEERSAVGDRIVMQDVLLAAIAEHGFALADGSTLIDYDVVSGDTGDVAAGDNAWSVAAFRATATAVVETCRRRGWSAVLRRDDDVCTQITIASDTDVSVVADIVCYESSLPPERRPGGGLRLVFADIAAGKAVAVVESGRGRDFFDVAKILATPGWTVTRLEVAMRSAAYGDTIEAFRRQLGSFVAGQSDCDVTESGFDAAWCHRILDEQL